MRFPAKPGRFRWGAFRRKARFFVFVLGNEARLQSRIPLQTTHELKTFNLKSGDCVSLAHHSAAVFFNCPADLG